MRTQVTGWADRSSTARTGAREAAAGRFVRQLFSLLVLGAGFASVPPPVAGQTPADTVPPDTAATDTLPGDTVPGDTLPPLEALPDTLPGDTLPGDTLPPLEPLPEALAEDTVAAADTIVHRLPELPDLAQEGWETGVWSWDRDELLATRATTLAELLGQIPGVIQLRGGDIGMPRAATAFGAAGGGLRVFRDGVEVLPLAGSVPDLTRVGLTGVEEVRVERTGAGLRVDLRSLRVDDPRPYSVIEAGTGDLDTNLLRGVFFHPRAFGGNAGVSLERHDTRGPGLQEPGSATAVWLHYAWLADDRLGVTADFSRSIADRDTLYAPNQVRRTDWRLRGRWEPVEGLVADLFWARAGLEADSTDLGIQEFPFRAEDRSQWGARLGVGRGPVSGRLTYRNFRGEGLADSELGAEVVGRLPGVGGGTASWERSSWPSRTTTTAGLRGWTSPLWGLSLFGSVEHFERGVPTLPSRPPDEEEDGNGVGHTPAEGATVPGDSGPRFTEGRLARAGARLGWRGLELSGARLDLERDSVHPLGLPVDRGGPSLAAGDRAGWEVSFHVPLLLVDGLALEGSGQLWEDVAAPGPYFPRRTWQGALSLHDTYLPSENLEVWFDLGVEGRDRMQVSRELPGDSDSSGGGPGVVSGTSAIRSVGPGAVGGHASGAAASALQVDPVGVPFYQSFYVRLQIRVVTVRVFASWENFTLRAENQDFPDRILPRTRAMYGVRWTLWN